MWLCDNRSMTWNAVPGYEGIYEAHRDPPRVRSLDRVVLDKHGRARCLRGRALGDRYGNLILSRDGECVHVTVAEVVELTFPTLAAAV